MKKFFATAMAVTMVTATLGTTAFAAEGPAAGSKTLTDEKKSVEITVSGEYVENQESPEVISMDIEWGAMNFTYAAKQQGTWQPTTHTYDGATEVEGWAGKTTSDIKVTNHSNVDVTASFEFEAMSGFAPTSDEADDGVKGSFSQKSVDLDAGVAKDEDHPNAYDEAATETVTFSIGGKLKQGTAKDTQIGTITVSVDKKVAAEDGE